MNPLQGVCPILATTFHDDGRVDFESQASLVDFLLAAGAHGLGLFGNASEGYALTGDERLALLKAIARQVDGRVPLVVSSGHTGTDAAVRLSQEAQEVGAAALMVLPPYFLKTDGDGLMFYYEAISKAVGIPIMVQDAPLLTQVAMPASLLARMGKEIEHVKYVKVEAPPTAPKITALLSAASGSLVLFGGLNGQFFLEEMERGARGAMPGSDMTALYVRLWTAFESGDKECAWELFTRMLPLMRFELQPGMGVSAMKHNLAAAGVISSTRVRHPTASLDEQSLRELEFLRCRLPQ
ncbi:MAG: dihydrodipicolinate synthase family protein [Bryobacteraceae bacterium]